jgi:hypothetical protein
VTDPAGYTGAVLPRPGDVPFFVITRAGVSLDGEPVPEDWLRGRAQLFRDYFVPALNGQTDQDFTLLVCLDERVDERIVTEFTSSITCPYEVIRTGHPWGTAVSERLAGHDGIITATCDSDDALARDFVTTTRRTIRPERWLNFQQVIRYSPETGRFVMKPKPSNPFVSRHSGSGGWVLGAGGDHAGIGLNIPLDDVWFPPMGLQVVHGKNVANKMWPYVPPLSPRFVRRRFSVDFPNQRSTTQFLADYLRYLLDPRGFLLLVRRKGVKAALRTLLRR